MTKNQVFQRLLRAAKRIDTGGAVVQSAVMGLPQHIYSYRHNKTIDIGKETYRGLNKYLKTQTVVGEYADPTMKRDPVADYVERYHALHPTKEYDDDLLLEFESLASIADKLNSETNGSDDNELCEMEDLSDFDVDSDGDPDDQLMPLPDPPRVMLKHIPGANLDAQRWKGALMLQHPMSVSDAYGTDAVPSLMLGVDVSTMWHPDAKKQSDLAEQRVYHGVMVNQPSILDVSYIIKTTTNNSKKVKHCIKTSHGTLTVPRMFHESTVYIGGDDHQTAEVITTSKYCKGIPIMNGHMFMNPDLTVAKRMIEAGHATLDEFRFFLGKMTWNSDLFHNVHRDRNMYSAFEVDKTLSSKDVRNLMTTVWNGNGYEDPWSRTLRFAPQEWSSWITLQQMMYGPHNPEVQCGCEELKKLKKMHQTTVAKQISHWRQGNSAQ